MANSDEPGRLACLTKKAIDIASNGVSVHLSRQQRHKTLVLGCLNYPDSAKFRRILAPLPGSVVWGGLVSADNIDKTRSTYTRYLVYLNEDPKLQMVVFEGETSFHHADCASDPEDFQEKWELFHRL